MEDENGKTGFVAGTPENDGSTKIMYANDTAIGYSLSDVRLRFAITGVPQCDIHMSFTTAKTLANMLTASIREFEAQTKHEIMDMVDVQRGMNSSEAEK